MRTRYTAEPVVKIANESDIAAQEKKKLGINLSLALGELQRESVISSIARAELNALSKPMVVRTRSSDRDFYSRDRKFSSQRY